MKTTGVSGIPKFGLLDFLGHPSGQSITLKVTATLGCHGAGFLMRDLSDMSKFRLSHWTQVVPWSMKYLKNIHHSS